MADDPSLMRGREVNWQGTTQQAFQQMSPAETKVGERKTREIKEVCGGKKTLKRKKIKRRPVRCSIATYSPPGLQVNWPDLVVNLGIYCAKEERAILVRLQSVRRITGSGEALTSGICKDSPILEGSFTALSKFL